MQKKDRVGLQEGNSPVAFLFHSFTTADSANASKGCEALVFFLFCPSQEDQSTPGISSSLETKLRIYIAEFCEVSEMSVSSTSGHFAHFLPRCMECRRGLTMRFLSVCPSVCLSNACIVIKRKKAMFRFLYHMKEHLSQFSQKENGWWGATPFT